MIKANEVREIRANEERRLEEEKIARCEKWLDNGVTEEIKKHAKSASRCVTVTKPTNIDRDLVIVMLELNGYTVAVRNGLVDISW